MQDAIATRSNEKQRDTACPRARDYTCAVKKKEKKGGKNGEIIRILPTQLISAISRDRWYMTPIKAAFSLGPKVGISDPERGAF